MRIRNLAVLVVLLLAACAGTTEQTSGVDRMYVINCGENHAKDVSRWTPGVNVGQPHVFSNHCYLVKHAKGWMLWDTGNPDRIAAMPSGFSVAGGAITAYMKKPLAESLKEIGVTPADIKHFAMSHAHGDHSGNANLFTAATLYVQRAEYAAMFGPEPQKFGFISTNFEKLRSNPAMILDGDHDVFGDGTVLIKAAPGHTPGHQVLVVRLPKTGPVMLSGDMVHLQYSWNYRVVPSFNFDVPQSMATIDAMKVYARESGAQLWINHDMEQNAKLPKAPAFVQ
ncbi:MAG TPA: N-acyl homoserine lactonase family protein [Burkholderiales bacterium]|nr:N-acyl homoserine lactonase family protein [Burkholderiales bacterium]